MGAGTRIDFTLDPNTANPFSYVWVDENDRPIDYSGSTFKLQAKARNANGMPTGTVLLTLATGSGISGALADGEFDLEFPSVGGLAQGSYIYTCLRLVAGVAVEPMCWGNIDVEAGIAAA